MHQFYCFWIVCHWFQLKIHFLLSYYCNLMCFFYSLVFKPMKMLLLYYFLISADISVLKSRGSAFWSIADHRSLKSLTCLLRFLANIDVFVLNVDKYSNISLSEWLLLSTNMQIWPGGSVSQTLSQQNIRSASHVHIGPSPISQNEGNEGQFIGAPKVKIYQCAYTVWEKSNKPITFWQIHSYLIKYE